MARFSIGSNARWVRFTSARKIGSSAFAGRTPVRKWHTQRSWPGGTGTASGRELWGRRFEEGARAGVLRVVDAAHHEQGGQGCGGGDGGGDDAEPRGRDQGLGVRALEEV